MARFSSVRHIRDPDTLHNFQEWVACQGLSAKLLGLSYCIEEISIDAIPGFGSAHSDRVL